MWALQRKKQKYEAVAGDEEEQSALQNASRGGLRKRPKWTMWFAIAGTVLLVVLVMATIGSVFVPSLSNDSSVSSGDLGPQDDNKNPIEEPYPAEGTTCPQRREWRSLSRSEQQDYVSAVLCLRDRPSKIAPNSNRTAYGDWPWIHSHVGYYTHNSAPFLPWHRYFLHLYETTLREVCDFKGSLVYWDWTLDSDALEKSPVFDPDTGFGGDGAVGGDITVGRSGRCVADGPFNDVVADYYDVKYQPHCLSRGFRDLDGNLGHIEGHAISPESIEEVLRLDSYEDFVALMESRVHDAIPFGIGGDFETFTAPYDPLFFLHHTQLDRLWWLWQQRDVENRLTQYGGHKQRHSPEMATLDDELTMQNLAPAVKVSQVMNIKGDFLCNDY